MPAELSSPLTRDGGCLCGAIRFRAAGQPLRVTYCHCTQCRRHSGAPLAAFAVYRRDQVAWINGAPRHFRSSDSGRRGFCPECGTSLTWESFPEGDEVDLGVGCFDEAGGFSPLDHLWTQSALPWFHVDDTLPRHRRGRPKD